MNDVSQRNFQRSDKSGWYRGKSLDTFGPVGPVVTTGTPSGVGPIAPGDVIEIEINGIGVLRNPVERAGAYL